MNERIRLLAEQAFLAVGTTHDSINHQDQSVLDKNDTITVYTFTQNTMDKFAELIVRECGQTLVDNTPVVDLDNDWNKGYDRAMNDCIHHIYEHFGVEE
jgi:hypothetical protein